MEPHTPFWNQTLDALLQALQTNADTGLTQAEANRRFRQFGANTIHESRNLSNLQLLWRQFSSPFMLLLLFTDGLSFTLGEHVDAIIIFSIILLSGLISFWQEKGANDIVEKLLALVRVKALVLREGKQKELDVEEVVPGDILLLAAGDVIPADARLLASKDLFISEAALTGEPYPVNKMPSELPIETALKDRKNVLYKGTHIVSGTGKALAISTGRDTEFGKIAQHVKSEKAETSFEHGLRRFSYLLMEIVLLLTFVIFAVNIYFHRPFIDSLLFSLALAIGVTPFLLPAIVGISLAYGARHMASRKVIVKRLAAIENFGSMNVFCSDKTGTLTSGEIVVQDFLDTSGNSNPKVLQYARWNALAETGYKNPIDEAIRNQLIDKEISFVKLDETPFDFIRKKLSVLIEVNGERLMVTKGAFHKILDICDQIEIKNSIEPIDNHIETLENTYKSYSSEGCRIIGVCYKKIEKTGITRSDEANMIFLGMVLFTDPPKKGIIESVARMRELGIRLKILSGDSQSVNVHLGKLLHLNTDSVLIGSELHKFTDVALAEQVKRIDIFAELEPSHKERIVRLLSHAGNVVGYMGDGINDISSLHVADVSISVSNAVDVAKSTADFVLLEKDLNVLLDGILEGRKTFVNSLKYTFMTTSANFGNVISMGIASLFLPFLPLLPKQILATQFISDLPAMTIPSDNVDADWLDTPKRWDIGFIKKFMVAFGLLSTVFDMITFAVLLWWLKSTPEEFRSGWFTITILTEFVVLWVLRSKKVFYKSRPGKLMLFTTLIMFIFIFILPFTILGQLLDLDKMPVHHIGVVLGIVALYALSNEMLKIIFYKRVKW